ncbi:prepilin-type N-terminal cleavage/methylation domain-containing protein [Candidatus Omnitrophota bacterium]
MKKQGLTLVEVLIVVTILAFAITALLYGYTTCVTLNEHDRRFSQAMNIARELMEKIYNQRTDFDAIVSQEIPKSLAGEDNDMTELYGFPGSASVQITDPVDDLKLIKIVICWEEKGGRIIGDDVNLNGEYNDGIDKNTDGNDVLDSVCTLRSAITDR